MPDLQNLLDQIDRLDQKSTPGKWVASEGTLKNREGWSIFVDEHNNTVTSATPGDAEFIALARTALPQLSAVIRRLKECAQTLTEDNNDASDYASGIHEAVECFEHIITNVLEADDA